MILKNLRDKGIKVSDLAKKLGFSRTTIYSYTSGRRFPTKRIAKKLKSAGISLDELLED